jgi:excisionase family DNA binding protein
MEKLLLRPIEAAELIGVCRSTIYQMLAAGELPSVRVGSRHLIPADLLRQWVHQKVQRGHDTANVPEQT